jgi:predicted RecB family nuclease
MLITDEILAAYLKCETKAYLKVLSTVATDSEFADWQSELLSRFKQYGIAQLQHNLKQDEYFAGAPTFEVIRSGRFSLLTDCSLTAQNLRSTIHALERIVLKDSPRKYGYAPTRFTPNERITKDDKLLLAFDALILSSVTGQRPSFGRLVHGSSYKSIRIKMADLLDSAKELVGRISLLGAANHSPDLILNRHCAECEFRTRCKESAIKKDELSLLSRLTPKERSSFHSKGIFSIFQLSHTFRPRRKPRRLSATPEKYSHALKALAIRENKIHVVGRPDLQLSSCPIYLNQTARGWHTQAALSSGCFSSSFTAAVTSAV